MLKCSKVAPEFLCHLQAIDRLLSWAHANLAPPTFDLPITYLLPHHHDVLSPIR
jgi:hypothetical protein